MIPFPYLLLVKQTDALTRPALLFFYFNFIIPFPYLLLVKQTDALTRPALLFLFSDFIIPFPYRLLVKQTDALTRPALLFFKHIFMIPFPYLLLVKLQSLDGVLPALVQHPHVGPHEPAHSSNTWFHFQKGTVSLSLAEFHSFM